jgi:hypothetical protein
MLNSKLPVAIKGDSQCLNISIGNLRAALRSFTSAISSRP